MLRIFIIVINMLVFYAGMADACTAAIISGKITPDGRPILWKNRDSSDLLNCVRHMKGEKFDYVAVTNYSDNPRSVWSGTNSAGFAIMNTLSYNLMEADGSEGISKKNGALMKRALEICADVSDFRNYLDTLCRPMRVRSNYGVIDAQGGGSFFEVNGTEYKEYDVNDFRVAPHGYLVRANFSFSGTFNDGSGYVRYQEAQEKLFTASVTGEITPKWLFTNLSRSFHNPLLGIDLKNGRYNRPETNGWFVEQDFIARLKSTCAVAVQGVKKGEDPSFTTMWTVIGYPPVTPAVPVWVSGSETKLPQTVSLKDGRCALCDAASHIRDKIYSYHRGLGTELYFNWELLYNKHGTGYMQRNESLEDSLFDNVYSRIDKWRDNPSVPVKEIFRLYGDFDKAVNGMVTAQTSIILKSKNIETSK